MRQSSNIRRNTFLTLHVSALHKPDIVYQHLKWTWIHLKRDMCKLFTIYPFELFTSDINTQTNSMWTNRLRTPAPHCRWGVPCQWPGQGSRGCSRVPPWPPRPQEAHSSLLAGRTRSPLLRACANKSTESILHFWLVRNSNILHFASIIWHATFPHDICWKQKEAEWSIPGIDNVAEVRRKGAIVGGASCLWVGVGLGEIVREFARPCEHFTRVIRTIYHLDLHRTWRGDETSKQSYQGGNRLCAQRTISPRRTWTWY